MKYSGSEDCNYRKYIKGKLRKEGHELVSAPNQFKLAAADDKCVDRSHVGKKEYLQAMRTSGANISLGSSLHCRFLHEKKLHVLYRESYQFCVISVEVGRKGNGLFCQQGHVNFFGSSAI